MSNLESINSQEEIKEGLVSRYYELCKFNESFDTQLKVRLTASKPSEAEIIKAEIAGDIELLLTTEKPEEISKFFDQLESNRQLLIEFQTNPILARDFLICVYFGRKTLFENEKSVENFIYNFNLYQNDFAETDLREEKRKKTSPLASDEEYNAGVYKDSLEFQVSDAVFILRKKGYNTFESGFGDLVTGEQMVGFWQEDFDTEPFVPETLRRALIEKGVNIELEKEGDVEPPPEKKRYQILLIPMGDKLPSLEEWKEIWDLVAKEMPIISEGSEPINDNTLISKSFREEQKKIRQRQTT